VEWGKGGDGEGDYWTARQGLSLWEEVVPSGMLLLGWMRRGRGGLVVHMLSKVRNETTKTCHVQAVESVSAYVRGGAHEDSSLMITTV
jgi:hypothetical protein